MAIRSIGSGRRFWPGVGGVRAIRAFTEIEGLRAPEVFHMNEGHAGFLGVERIREYMVSDGLDFETALTVVRASTVFTTHTQVPAGIDRFPMEMVRRYFDDDRPNPLLPGVPLVRVIEFGAEDDPSKFNMAHMGLRLAQRANGRCPLLHGRVSRQMFNGLWPGFDAEEVPIGSVTNGVHAPTWAAPQWVALADEVAARWFVVGVGNVGSGCSKSICSGCGRSGRCCVGCWWMTCGCDCTIRGWSAARRKAELGWIATAFDPNVLTIGFARRVPTYKRLTLMLRDPENDWRCT